MSPGLVLNPFASLSESKDEHGDVCIDVTAPKPGESLQWTRVPSTRETALFLRLASIPRDGVRPLAVPAPLPLRHVARLREMGLLVERDSVPQWPRYSCVLKHGARGSIVPNGAKALPRARCNALSENVKSLFERRLYFRSGPSVLLEDPVTKLAFPYWVEDDVRAADLRVASADSSVVAALRRGGLRVAKGDLDGARRAWRSYVRHAGTELQRAGHTTIAGAVPSAHVTALRRYFSALVAGGFLEVEHGSRRVFEHNNAVGRVLHNILLPLITELAGEPLKPSYVYFASYPRGTALHKHTDREQCEITVSLLVDFEPRSSGALDWPIKLVVLGPRGNEKVLSVTQRVGDMVIFRGRRLPHYRPTLRAAQRTHHLFLHYVRSDFAGSLD